MDSLAALHFLRPYWLFALVPLAWLFFSYVHPRVDSSSWKNIVDPDLLPHLLNKRDAHSARARWLLAIAWLLGTIAMAGPTWTHEPVAAYRAQAARVVVLDVSRSMDATDLAPSRLARAKLKVLDMLQRTRGEHTALIAYAEHPYVVAPLTHDARTVANLVPALATDVVPLQGSRPDRALLKAANLFRQSGLAGGEIVLVTDGIGDPMLTRDTVRRLAQQRFRISVLAVGTPDGAPIPLANGSFVKDKSGATVIPHLDNGALRELAALGGGAFTTLSTDDSDIDLLLRTNVVGRADGAEKDKQNIGRWQDRGIYFVVALLPLAALGLRRGWLASFALILVVQPGAAYAMDWDELWSRPEQAGVSLLDAGQPTEAIERFDDPMWRGVAYYRAQRYAEAAAEFVKLATPTAHYNRGNALAQLGQMPEALAAYDAALAAEPDHTDAQFNRALIAKLIAQQEQSSANTAANAPRPDSDKKEGKSRHNDSTSARRGTSENDSAQTTATAAQHAGASGATQAGTGTRDNQAQNHSSASDARKNGGADPVGAHTSREADVTPQPNPNAADSSNDGTVATRDAAAAESVETREAREAREQWLRRIPDDPGGLLRRKFARDQQREQASPGAEQSQPESAHAPW